MVATRSTWILLKGEKRISKQGIFSRLWHKRRVRRCTRCLLYGWWCREGVRIAEPILTALAVKGGYIHTGKPGTGHFVKLVHNGIEFGMLQSIGEGVELLSSNFGWTWQHFQ